MVSCYARDAYLGRYLIKRNFFYTAEREKFADNAYDGGYIQGMDEGLRHSEKSR
jgi:hypothetical protein